MRAKYIYSLGKGLRPVTEITGSRAVTYQSISGKSPEPRATIHFIIIIIIIIIHLIYIALFTTQRRFTV